ncbi:uncharacterized protein LOC116144691 isoform X3 [Pistacia vera]|uniref:uncharacterized protein LOC116144691 isoform X3 n=1 Tax=Pistacia vera TaxID=55513 RepID=UPI001263E572|nr:uncharacterized protein LOC116144691 isoform X3 [Pistacia vera]
MGSSTFGERTPMDSLVLEKVTTEPQQAAKVVPALTKIECLSGICIKLVKLAALGSEHSVAVTDGEVLSWGGGGSGRLGDGYESSILGFLSSSSSSEYTPRLIKELEKVKGQKCTF